MKGVCVCVSRGGVGGRRENEVAMSTRKKGNRRDSLPRFLLINSAHPCKEYDNYQQLRLHYISYARLEAFGSIDDATL